MILQQIGKLAERIPSTEPPHADDKQVFAMEWVAPPGVLRAGASGFLIVVLQLRA